MKRKLALLKMDMTKIGKQLLESPHPDAMAYGAMLRSMADSADSVARGLEEDE